jgi:fatty acid CoA ligase FadD32
MIDVVGDWVAAHRPPDATENYSELVSCGAVTKNPSIHVKIVDPTELTDVEEGRVGEIWLHSRSVAGGYYHLEDETAAAFNCNSKAPAETEAKLDDSETKADDGVSLGYLRTGDLGCIVGGELYVVSRIKDMIIIRGRNHYPQVWFLRATRGFRCCYRFSSVM